MLRSRRLCRFRQPHAAKIIPKSLNRHRLSEDRSRTWAHEVGELLFSDKNEIRRQLERERGREPATIQDALLGAVSLLIVNNAIAVGIPLALRVLLDRRMRDEKAVTH